VTDPPKQVMVYFSKTERPQWPTLAAVSKQNVYLLDNVAGRVIPGFRRYCLYKTTQLLNSVFAACVSTGKQPRGNWKPSSHGNQPLKHWRGCTLMVHQAGYPNSLLSKTISHKLSLLTITQSTPSKQDSQMIRSTWSPHNSWATSMTWRLPQ